MITARYLAVVHLRKEFRTAKSQQKERREGRERTENQRKGGITECSFSFVHLS